MGLLLIGRTFWVTLIGAVATLSFASSAFTNSISTPGTNSATSTSVIGEFMVDTANVTYTLSTTDPRNVASVSFPFTGGASTPTFAKIRAVSSTTNWYTCSISGAAPNFTATCPTTSPQWTLVSDLTNMTSLAIVIRD